MNIRLNGSSKNIITNFKHQFLYILIFTLIIQFICRMIVEQINCERDKLKYDVDSANNRAVMLAQEVDENHIQLEKSLAKKIE